MLERCSHRSERGQEDCAIETAELLDSLPSCQVRKDRSNCGDVLWLLVMDSVGLAEVCKLNVIIGSTWFHFRNAVIGSNELERILNECKRWGARNTMVDGQ